MEAHCLDIGCAEAEEVVHNVFMIARKHEGFASERCTVYHFSLLMTDSLFDDTYHELRSFMVELICWIVKVSKESLDSLTQFFAGDLLSVSDALGILEDLVPVSPALFLIRQDLREPYQVQRARSCP